VKRKAIGTKGDDLLERLRRITIPEITLDAVLEGSKIIDGVCDKIYLAVVGCKILYDQLDEIIDWANDGEKGPQGLKCFVFTYILNELLNEKQSKIGKLYCDEISTNVFQLSFSLIEVMLKIYANSGIGHTIDNKGTTFCQRVLSKGAGNYLSILTKRNKYGSFILCEPNSEGQTGIHTYLSYDMPQIQNKWIQSLLLRSYRTHDDMIDCNGKSLLNKLASDDDKKKLIEVVTMIDDKDTDDNDIDIARVDDGDDEDQEGEHELDRRRNGNFLRMRDEYQSLFTKCTQEIIDGLNEDDSLSIPNLVTKELFKDIHDTLESTDAQEIEDVIKLRLSCFATIGKFINNGIVDKQAPGGPINNGFVNTIFNNEKLFKKLDGDDDSDGDSEAMEEEDD